MTDERRRNRPNDRARPLSTRPFTALRDSMTENPSDEVLHDLLLKARRIAVVGASANPERASHSVALKLKTVGYTVLPVNPNEASVIGEKAFSSLSSVPSPIDIVDVFRRTEEV